MLRKYKKHINRKYSKEFKMLIKKTFSKKIGMDVANYIMIFIEPNNNPKCVICNEKIRTTYVICNDVCCKKQVCFKCYKIISRYSMYIPFCEYHFSQKYYNKELAKRSKRYLVKQMKHKSRYRNINLIQYFYKKNNEIVTQFYDYDSNHNFFKTPKLKYIKSHFYITIHEPVMTIFITDNIYDTFYYNLF